MRSARAAATIANLAARDTAVAVTVGLAAGLDAGVLTTRALASSLFGISHTDPATYAAAAASLSIGVLIAVIGPARLATSADPVTILRAE